MKDRVALLLAAFWWGSLSTVGFLVVPMAFARLGSPTIAGNFAGQLFAAQSWIAVVCGLILLAHFRQKADQGFNDAVRLSIGLVLAALLLALLQQYAVAPRIMARQDLGLWHPVGSGMYLLQWLCAGTLLWRLGGRVG
jgi:uncharacterized membrane protein